MNKRINKQIAFLDCETTGLSIDHHEIIEVGAIIYDQTKDCIIDEWEKKIAPSNIELADKESLMINGYYLNPSAYNGNLERALIKLNNLLADKIIIGQNIKFDTGFIRKHMRLLDIAPKFKECYELDLMSMAWPVLFDKDISGLSLSKMCSYFNISNVGEHRALADCKRTFEVYQCLIKAYRKTM